MIKPRDEGGLGWGTFWGSMALFVLLVALVIYQTIQVRRHPLEPLPYPVNRRTGEPQEPNGAVVTSPSHSSEITDAGEGSAPSRPRWQIGLQPDRD